MVFEEDLEDILFGPEADANSVKQDRYYTKMYRDVCARGAFSAFVELDVAHQRACAEVSIMELSACLRWAETQSAAAPLGPAWAALTDDEKASWVGADPRATLALDGRWAALLAEGPPPCGAPPEEGPRAAVAPAESPRAAAAPEEDPRAGDDRETTGGRQGDDRGKTKCDVAQSFGLQAPAPSAAPADEY